MPDFLATLFSHETQSDPFPVYRRLQTDYPVYLDRESGCWALSRYADIVAAARNHAVFSSAQGVGPGKYRGSTLLNVDPPDHTRMRGLVSRAFLPGTVEGLAPRVEEICNQLIDRVAGGAGTFDLMEDFAIPLPLMVIAEVMGLDPARYADYRRWSQAAVRSLDQPDSLSAQGQYAQTSQEFFTCLSKVAADRFRSPRNDLISLLIQARVEREALTPQEIVGNCELFLTAGSETTSAVIGNAAVILAANPGEALQAIHDPALIPTLIEECLRFDGPFQGDYRTTTTAVTLHGVEIPAGAKVVLLWTAANRDPAVFPDADRFIGTRSPNPHVAFGHGIHHCIGAPLARLEARVAANVLLKRFRHLAPDPQRPPVRSFTNPAFRAYSSVPMSFALR